ncbi:unnamed protein product [Lasius platythorax]|uniref:Uncharacterized protein n=1 Tax=Lasius platythorax TaxID=488582 RepID=A0AAV2NYI0_9HYME
MENSAPIFRQFDIRKSQCAATPDEKPDEVRSNSSVLSFPGSARKAFLSPLKQKDYALGSPLTRLHSPLTRMV